jgi:hypothetical protein
MSSEDITTYKLVMIMLWQFSERSNGLPISINNAAGVERVSFELKYDPNLLSFTDAILSPNLPEDWIIHADFSQVGKVIINLSGSQLTTQANQDLVILQAFVPDDATLGNSQILSLTNLSLNQGNIAVVADKALQQVAYVGDVSGNGSYSSLDASLIARVAKEMDAGFDFYQNTDPIILAGIENKAILSENDALAVARKTVGLLENDIPDLPNVVNVDLTSVKSELSSFFRTIANELESELSDVNIPIVGENFDKIGIEIADAFDILTNEINSTLNDSNLLAQEVAEKLSLIPGLTATVTVNTQDRIEFSLDYENSVGNNVPLFSEGGGLLDFIELSDNFSSANVSVETSYYLDDLIIGIDNNNTYIDKTSSNLEILTNLDLPDTTINGLKLGLLNLELTEPQEGNNFGIGIDIDLDTFDSVVDYNNLGIINLFSVNVAVVNGSIDLPGIGEVEFGLPEIKGKLQLNFSTATTTATIPFRLADITLDLGNIQEQFITPFVTPIVELTKPLKEVIDLLYEPIPLLDDLAKEIPLIYEFLDRGGNVNGTPEISIRDIVAFIAEIKGYDVDFLEFFDRGFQILDLFNNLELSQGQLILGNIEFDRGNAVEERNEVGSQINSTLPEGISIPLLERPVDVIFSLLFGNNTDLITYSTPLFEFKPTIGEIVPILGPLGVFIGGNFDIKAQFSFGFDTFGLTTGSLEDGFYINDKINGEDNQEVTFNLGPSFGPGLELGVASIAIYLNYSGGIGLNWHDDDGKLRLEELNEILVDSFKPFELFDLGINLGAGFGAEVSLVGITLWQPEINGSIEIAEISGTEIQSIAGDLIDTGKDAVEFLKVMNDIFSGGITFSALKEFVEFLFDEDLSIGIDDVITILRDGLSVGIDTIAQLLWEYLGNPLIEIAEELADGASRVWEYTEGVVSKLWEYAGDTVTQLTEWFSDGTSKVWEYTEGVVSKLWEYAGDTVTQLTEWFSDGTSKVTEWFIDGTSKVTEWFIDGTSKVTEWFIDGTSKVTEWFIDGTSKVTEWFIDGTTKAWSYVGDILTRLDEWFSDGTSKVSEWLDAGRYVENYFNQGINYLRKTFQDGWEVLRQTWDAVGNYIEDAWDAVGNYLGRNVWDAAGNLIESVTDIVDDWIDTVDSWF